MFTARIVVICWSMTLSIACNGTWQLLWPDKGCYTADSYGQHYSLLGCLDRCGREGVEYCSFVAGWEHQWLVGCGTTADCCIGTDICGRTKNSANVETYQWHQCIPDLTQKPTLSPIEETINPSKSPITAYPTNHPLSVIPTSSPSTVTKNHSISTINTTDIPTAIPTNIPSQYDIFMNSSSPTSVTKSDEISSTDVIPNHDTLVTEPTNKTLFVLVICIFGVMCFMGLILHKIGQRKASEKDANEHTVQLIIDANESVENQSGIQMVKTVQLLDEYHCDQIKTNYMRRADNTQHICEFENCAILQRTRTDNKVFLAEQQIKDKIHCYYSHSSHIFEDKQQMVSLRKAKYNQFFQNDRQFRFGRLFHYEKEEMGNDSDGFNVKRRYCDLKQELTANKIQKLAMGQFTNESKKADYHFQCNYRKKYHPCMAQKHILALMVYCNFDKLQCEFSKTYREAIAQHAEFYHLGKLLKQSVINHGTRVKDGNVYEFYHGIGTKLLPAQIVGRLGKGISIYCPLSTTVNSEVAINFADYNNGLVITFGNSTSKAKYFSVAWLSDYPSENEYLFIQNKEELQIENITVCSCGTEFKEILDALKTMDAIMSESHCFQHEKSAQIMAEPLNLIIRILHHQLSIAVNGREWKGFTHLQSYGQDLLDVYFKNKKKLMIHYSVLEKKYQSLFKLICLTDCEWIRTDILMAVFPNICEIEIIDIDLCSNVMELISDNRKIFDHDNKCWNLRKMTIKLKKSSSLKASEAVTKYDTLFRNNKIRITIEQIDRANEEYDTLQLK